MQMHKATMDGNEAAAHVSYAFTEIAAIYPITPSSPMAEHVDLWAARGRKNIFGQEVRLIEMQSEGGATGTMHGAMEAGALTSSYTSSQGLLLMVPVMYRMAGYLKAGVIHVAARSVASNAYSIAAEHSDVMACRQTGFAMLAAGGVQEVMDLGAVAHLASIKSRVPFVHFFDGFRTSHELQKIDCLPYEGLAKLVDYEALEAYRKSALNPEYPLTRTPGLGADVYFQSMEVRNPYYDRLSGIVQDTMDALAAETGRRYGLFQYFGAPNAERVVVAMGSVCGTVRETMEALNAGGEKVGLIEVHLYRPFSAKHFLQVLPATAKTLIALDRTKEPGAPGEPLYQDICAVMNEGGPHCRVLAGRYGLGGKDVTPAEVDAVFQNAAAPTPKNHFTVGIVDDVTFTSLPVGGDPRPAPEGLVSCKFWGYGSDGTVGANKSSIKIIGDATDKYVQANFEYDSKKTGGVTISHLRFGDAPIQSAYGVRRADFVACHKQTYLAKYDMISELRPGGTFLLNCDWSDAELEEQLPALYKKYIAQNGIRLFTIGAMTIARELGLGGFYNAVLQAAFFKAVPIIPVETAVAHMKESLQKTYGKKGDEVIAKNLAAVDRGVAALHEVAVPTHWANAQAEEVAVDPALPEFIRRHMLPVNARQGETLTVADFADMPDSGMPVGTSKYEKRGIAVDISRWKPENCIQCNQCALVCPHAAIRPFLLTGAEAQSAPAGYATLPATGKGLEGFHFRMQVSPLDCTGCGSCAQVCPAKAPALAMAPLAGCRAQEEENWEYSLALSPKENPLGTATVKGSQFEQPLLEFSCACAGCAQTPYAKLVTQLYGERMYVATATGCSSVWATGYPGFSYTTNRYGRGPAYSNSLFENNGEFGLGMQLAVEYQRARLRLRAQALCDAAQSGAVRDAAADWLAQFDDPAGSRKAGDRLAAVLRQTPETGETGALADEILRNAEHLAQKSVWIFGGDGWAYDIGYGGLDHVLSVGANVNILVLDTEVYSNTGGQASKASPRGAVAQFAVSGRKARKKDLGAIAMEYDDVYVAQIAMGADYNQSLKAIREAGAHPGTSLIIAYAPCIAHGLRGGMGTSQQEMKRAVQAGYWHLYRRDPKRKALGQNPFVLDSKEPSADYRAFLLGETRYAALQRTFPNDAEALFRRQEQDAREKYAKYKALADKPPEERSDACAHQQL